MHQVDGQNVYVRHKLSTMTYDVIVEMHPSESGLGLLDIGMKIKYSGTIEYYGGKVLSHRITDGHVISSTPMCELEKTRFLKDSELAGVKSDGN